jgi:hypothetical protein
MSLMSAADIIATSCPHPNEVDRKRIEKTLSERERYKYVAPSVLPDVDGYLVRSPCCSRNVDPDGGEIDIARIEYQEGGFWRLYQKDDAQKRWRAHSEYLSLLALLALLMADPKKVFWR